MVLFLLLLPLLLYYYLHSFVGFSSSSSSSFEEKLLSREGHMTLKVGTSQACAACKYQRRRCTPECPLAPYFPPDQPKLFQNAHKLFGVSNILKILKKLEPEQMATAMWSIIYQANERDRDPVHGCLSKINHLRYQIWMLEQELAVVNGQLDMCRQQHHHRHNLQHQQMVGSMVGPQDLVMTSQLELGMAPPSNGAMSIITDDHHHQAYDSNNVDAILLDSKDIDNGGNVGINPLWVQYPCTTNNNNIGNSDINVNGSAMATIQSQTTSFVPLDIQQEVVQDYDEMPFFDTMDDRQSYMDSKEAYESSSEESVLKDTTQSINDRVADNELKSAAACLSLTSVN